MANMMPGRGLVKRRPMPPPPPNPAMAIHAHEKNMEAMSQNAGLPGYATGVEDVSGMPSPGQTITSGSWDPNAGTNSTGQAMRKSLGMGVPRPPQPKPAGAPGFATGTPDVPTPPKVYVPPGASASSVYVPPGASPSPYTGITRWGGGEATPDNKLTEGYGDRDSSGTPHNMKRGASGFAMGTPDVPTPPKPGDTVTSGSWDPNTGTNSTGQSIRKSLGMGVPRPGYAGGSPDVPPPSMGGINTAMRSQPSMVTPVDISGFNDPTQQPTNNGFGMALSSMMTPAGAQAPVPAPAMPQGQPGGSLPQGQPAAPQAQVVQPTIMDSFAHMLGMGPPPAATIVHPSGLTKTPDDMDRVNAVANGTGVSHGYAHAMTEPHQYSESEFLDATKGMSYHQLDKLWAFQHYLNPDQQIVPMVINQFDKLIAEQEAAGQAALKAGDSAGVAAANKMKLQHQQELMQFMRTKALGQSTALAGLTQ
jgi:hypothetical protein